MFHKISDNQAQRSKIRVPFEVTTTQRTPEWAEERKKIVTASIIASILPFTADYCKFYYQTYQAFFKGKPWPPFNANKSCNIYEDEKQNIYNNSVPKDNKAMKHGRIFEPVAIQLFREMFLSDKEILDLVGLWNAGGPLIWFGCSADAIRLLEETQEILGPLEIKVRYSVPVVRGIPPPLQTWMQLQGEMLTFNAKEGDYFEVSFREITDPQQFVIPSSKRRGLFFLNTKDERTLNPPSLVDIDVQLAWAKKWANRLAVSTWKIVMWELVAYNHVRVTFNSAFWNVIKGKLKAYYDSTILPEIEYARQREEALLTDNDDDDGVEQDKPAKKTNIDEEEDTSKRGTYFDLIGPIYTQDME